MPLFSVGGKFGIGPAGNPQMRSPAIPRLKLNPAMPGQITIGRPPPATSPFGLAGSTTGGGGFLTSGGEGPTGPIASAARNAENAAKRSGDQIKQWLQQLAYGVGPFAKLMVDPSKAINAAMPGITEKMTGDFNEAANRLGATGMLGFSQGEMKAGTPYQDLLGQAAKSANLGREEIRSKYQFEADKANQQTMLDLIDKLGISGGGVSGVGGGGGGYRGAIESAAGGGAGGDPTRDPSSIWYNDAAGYKEYLAQQKAKSLGRAGGTYEEGLRDGESEAMTADFSGNVGLPTPSGGASPDYLKGWRAAMQRGRAAWKARVAGMRTSPGISSGGAG